MNPNTFRSLRQATVSGALALGALVYAGSAHAATPASSVAGDCKAAAQQVTCPCEKPKPHVQHRAHVVPKAPPPVSTAQSAPPPPPPSVAAVPPQPIVVQVQAPTPAPQPSQLQQLGLTPVIYDASKPILLPGASVVGTLSDADQKFVDASDCNYKGFWNAVAHPINAQCKSNEVKQTSSQVGVLGINGQGQAVFAAIGPTVVGAERSSTGTHGQGWLIPTMVAVGTVGGIVIGQEGVDIARQSLKVTQNLDNNIVAGINGGKFASVFGSLNCGNASAAGSTVSGGVNASCNLGNVAVDSVLGNGGIVSTTGTVANITAKLFNSGSSGAVRPVGGSVSATGMVPQ